MGANLASKSTTRTLVSLGVHHGGGAALRGGAVGVVGARPSHQRAEHTGGGGERGHRGCCGGSAPNPSSFAARRLRRRLPHPLPQHRIRRHRDLNSTVEHLGHLMHGRSHGRVLLDAPKCYCKKPLYPLNTTPEPPLPISSQNPPVAS
uniref:Uncharacterized protein n=1 Tax=Oryza nivara TaxID=4536 RepID=A0A0E0H231_ORYNI